MDAFDLLSYVVEPIGKPPALSNPLRLRKVSDRLGAELFPNLSVYTRRAKYFGLILHWADLGLLSTKNNNDRLDALTVAAEMFYGDPQSAVRSLVGVEIFRPLYANSRTGDLPRCNKIIDINSYSMYRNSLRALRVLYANDELTDRGRELLATLPFSKGRAYKDALKGYVQEGKAFPGNLRQYLKTWTLRDLPAEFKSSLRELVGLPCDVYEDGQNRDDAPKVRSELGPLLRYLHKLKIEEKKNFERLASGSIREIFLQRGDGDRFLKSIGWHANGANRHLRAFPLEDLYRHDRILFFLFAVFETMCLAALHARLVTLNISRIKLSVKSKATIDNIHNKLVKGLKKIEHERGERRSSKVSRGECSTLFSLAWAGLDKCRKAFPMETATVLASISERLPLSNFNQSVSKGSFIDAVFALVQLHIEYSRSRGVEPLLTYEGSQVTLVNPDITWLPNFGRDGHLFGYRIEEICDFLGDIV